MEWKKQGSNLLKVIMPLILGGAILYWMYRDFDFQTVGDVMLHEMNWTWMLLSFPFGILAQIPVRYLGTDDARLAMEADAGADLSGERREERGERIL